ncbi:MAG: hypothetical protein ACFE85_02675 [Candidatus Hodarchaeota archaeon]
MFPTNKDKVKCEHCGYTIVKPYPKNQLCPKCNKFLANLFEYKDDNINSTKIKPKNFETKTTTVSSRLKGVSVKSKQPQFSLEDEIIFLKDEEEYVKFCGVTSVDRKQLFHSNQKYKYLLELTNNLDFIATGILGGELDKMLLISKDYKEEKGQFYVKNGIIYIVYGVFPDKKGKWILEQMAKFYSDLVKGKDVNNLNKLEESEIKRDYRGILKSILKEYLALQDVFTDQDLPYLEDWIRIDYLGLSSMSIGVISLLLDQGEYLQIEAPEEYDNPAEEIEMKESLLTAKIEAIAANTLGNTGAYPRWIAVKLGFQNYRFLTFKKYQNDYFLSFLSEGNLKKIENVEKELEPLLHHGIDSPFSGNLKPFNRLKATLTEKFKNVPERKFS